MINEMLNFLLDLLKSLSNAVTKLNINNIIRCLINLVGISFMKLTKRLAVCLVMTTDDRKR